jgi:hypothetical protein
MEMHQAKGSAAVDDASDRKFDRDKDIVSRRIDAKSRQSMVEGAQKLDNRFSHGRKNFL